MPTELEWAKLAAYIDGEGCITLHRAHNFKSNGEKRSRMKSPYFFLSISVFNTDFRLPLWCKNNFGGSICVRRHSTNKTNPKHYGERPGATWRIMSKQAEVVLRNCLPHFILKREQAEIGIAYRDTVQSWGKGTVSKEVLQRREFLHHEISRIKKELPAGAEMPPEVIQ